MKNIYQENTNKKKPRVSILMSDQVAFGTKKPTEDKEGHYIMTE